MAGTSSAEDLVQLRTEVRAYRVLLKKPMAGATAVEEESPVDDRPADNMAGQLIRSPLCVH